MYDNRVLQVLDKAAKSWNPEDFAELYDLFMHYWPKEIDMWDKRNEEEDYG